MFDGTPMSSRMKFVRNLIAERALTRGRKLTASERIENLEAGLGYPKGHLRKALGISDRPTQSEDADHDTE